MGDTIQKPTCGRQVHYIPSENEKPLFSHDKVPATVMNDDICPDFSIMTGNENMPVVIKKRVPHIDSGYAGVSVGQWKWPEIK